MIAFFYFIFSFLLSIYLFWYFVSPFSANFWPRYLWHLALQQKFVVFDKIPIEDILKKEKEPKIKEKLETIIEVRNFGQEIYQLKNPKSFRYFVDLKRDSVGWNITATPEFSLEAVSWHFPLIGKFGYLGFFNYELALEKAKELKQKNYDVYLSEISGYSTLGIFPDPIFNVYLSYPKNYLVRLILHELAHEKLYFRDDSFFSESLASFIEKEASQRFFSLKGQNFTVFAEEQRKKTYEKFISYIEETKEELKKLYDSHLETSQKRSLKKAIFANLQKKIKSSLKEFSLIPQAHYLANLPELNNAILLQFRRYSPHYESFGLLLKEVQGDIPQWFAKLNFLKNCPKGRKVFLEKKISLKDALVYCQN